mgnify:FL=1
MLLVMLCDYFTSLKILNATERLEDQFDRTFEKFDAAIQSLRHLSLGSIDKFHPERLEVVAGNVLI